MKLLALCLALSVCCFAQTAKPKPAPIKSIRAELADTQQKLADSEAKRWDLVKKNQELEDANAALVKKNDAMQAAMMGSVKSDREFTGEYKKLLDSHTALAQSYNELLRQATIASQEAIALAGQNRQLHNAAVYQAIMSQKPYLLPMPERRPQIRCQTQRVGDTSYTNCN